MPRCVLTTLVALAALSAPLAYAEPPPISSATCRAKLEDAALVVDATMSIARPERADVSVRLLSNVFPLVGSLPRSDAARVTMMAGAYWLVVRPGAPRRAELKLAFRAPIFHGRDWLRRLRRFSPTLARDPALRGKWASEVTRDPTLRVCALPIVPATATTIDLPAECYDLKANPQAPVEQTAKGWRVYLPPRQRVFLLWHTTPPAAAVAPVFRIDAEASVTVARRSLTAETELSADVLQGELRGLTIALPQGAQLRSIEGKTIARWKLRGGKVSVTFAAPVTKRATLKLRAELLAGDDGEFDWQPVAVEGAQHQGGRAYFRAMPGLLLQAVGRKGFERVSDGYAPDAAAGRQTLVLAYPRLPASIRLAVQELQPRVTAHVAMLAQLERGVVTQHARIAYDIHDVGVRRFRVRVGEGADVLEATCPGLLDYDVADGVLTVRLRDAVKDKGQLELVVQRPMQRVDGVLIPRLTALEVERQTGLVGVAAGADVELRHQRAVEAEQIDVRLLPEWVRKLGPKLAYRYYDRPNSLVAVETAPLRPEFDVFARETCRLSDEGWSREVTWSCRVLRGEVFAWRVGVPEGVVPLAVDSTVPVGQASSLITGRMPVPQAAKGPRRAAHQTTVMKDWEFDEASRVLKVALSRGVTGEARLVARLAQRAADATAPGGTGILPVTQAGSLSHQLRGLTLEGVRRHSGQLMIHAAIPVALRAKDISGLETKRGEGSEWVFAEEAADWHLGLDATPIKPVISIQTVAVLGVRPGQVAVDAVLRFSIQKAPVNELRVRLPEGAVNSVVRGPDIKSSQLDGRDWTIRLARKVQGAYRLGVTYDHVTPAEGGACLCPTIEVPDAARHEGSILVARDSERIEVAVEQPKDLFESDPADAPREGAPKASRAIIDAYRYTGSGSLVVRIEVLARADVVQAKALGAVVETMIKQDGQTITQLTYDLQNASRQFLRVELPDDATLLGTYVDGKPMPSATDPKGGTLIPLLGGARAKGGTRQDDVLEVSIFYSQPQAPLGGGRRLTLLSPKVDVPTKTMSWAVYLPPGYRAQRTRGNMKLMSRPSSDRWGAVLGGMFADEAQLVGPALDWLGHAVAFVWFLIRVYAWWLLAALMLALAAQLAYRRRHEWREKWLTYRRARAERAGKRPRAVSPVLRVSMRPVIGWFVVILILAVLAGMLLPALSTSREEARRTRAQNNLRQIGKAMATYLNEHGDNRFYFGRAEQLKDICPDDSVFRDPSTGKRFVYLYEGKHLRDDYPPDRPAGYMEGESGANVLFFDGHVEFHSYGSDKLAKLLPGRNLRAPNATGGVVRKSIGDFFASRNGPEAATPPMRVDKSIAESERTLDDQLETLNGKKLDYGQQKLVDRLKLRAQNRQARSSESLSTPKPGTSVGYLAGPKVGADYYERPTRPAPKPKPGPDVGAPAEPPADVVPGGKPAEKKPAGPALRVTHGEAGGAVAGDVTEGQTTLYASSAYRYSAVRRGRQKGALPILFELPNEDVPPYIFYRPVAVHAQGELTLDCRPMGSSRSAKGVLIVGVVAFVALAGVGLSRQRKKSK